MRRLTELHRQEKLKIYKEQYSKLAPAELESLKDIYDIEVEGEKTSQFYTVIVSFFTAIMLYLIQQLLTENVWVAYSFFAITVLAILFILTLQTSVYKRKKLKLRAIEISIKIKEEEAKNAVQEKVSAT